MRKGLNRQRRNIVKAIKKNYMELQKGVIPKEPEKIRKLTWGIIICSLAVFVLELILILAPSWITWSLFGAGFIALCIFVFFYYLEERRLKDYRKKKIEDINELCEMIIEQEANKRGVSKDQLVIYLLQKYKSSVGIRVVTRIIPALLTAYAVYSLPGYDQVEHGVIMFIALVFANIFTSICAEFINLKIEEIDNFEFYVLEPYSKIFANIDEKLKGE